MNPPITFHDEQKKALDLSSGKLVVAGAGSGKTTVLAERYLRLLERDTSPDNEGLHPCEIVAMTFTNAAAASLRARIYGGLANRELEQPERSSFWSEKRDAMQHSRITTIHSFCTSVLKAYPQAAGVDPEMTIGPQATLARTQTLTEHLRQLAYRGDDDLRTVLSAFQKQRLQKAQGLIATLLGDPPLRRAIDLAERNLSEADSYLRSATLGFAELFNGEKFVSGKQIDNESWLKVLFRARRIAGALLPKAGELRSALTFNDLEHITLALLRGGSTAARHLRHSIKALLVDEFQDTSTLQWEIVSELVKDDNGRLDGSKLFLVGDEKQSIYAFREANVTVLHQARQQLCDGSSAVETVSLAENYRTTPALMDTLNPILHRLLCLSKYEGAAFVAQPQDLIAARDETGPGVFETKLVVGGDMSDSMEYIVSWLLENAGLDGSSSAEAGAVGQSNHRSQGGMNTLYTYSDIAILLKSRIPLPALEQALQISGIPYSISKGSGFFARPEVLDLINLVNAFADTRDDLARVATLRSPLFSLSDSAMAALFSGGEFRRERWELWLKIGDDCEFLGIVDEEDRSRLRLARVLWLELEVQAGRIDPVEWMRLALDQSGAWGAYAVGRRGEQALANLGKFLDLVRDICGEQGPDLRALVERLTLECDRADNEAESEADVSAGQGVRIMTIHSAKGLEFPVVILPLPSSLQKLRPPLRRGNLLAKESEYRPLTSPRLHDLSSNFADKKQITNVHDVMYNCCSKPEELAEQLRLLYVAATRSRDRLLVVPHAGFKKDGSFDAGNNSASELWLRACDVNMETLGERCQQAVAGSQDADDLLNTPSDMSFSWIPAQSISLEGTAQSLSDLPPQPPVFEPVTHPGIELAQPGRSVLVQVPLEAFAAWIANPTEEKARWLLSVGADENGTGTGIPRATASKGVEHERDIEADLTQTINVPQLSGVAFHQLMQRFGPRMSWNDAENWVRRWVKRSALLDARSRNAVVERVRVLVAANNSYPWAGAANARRELPVLLRLGDVILRGRIDLAWMEDQTAVALDLKTNDAVLDKLDELTEQHGYDHQAKLYALAYAASMGVDTAEGRLLFLPEKYEKRWVGVQDERQWYVARAAELVRYAEEYQYSAYAQESMV